MVVLYRHSPSRSLSPLIPTESDSEGELSPSLDFAEKRKKRKRPSTALSRSQSYDKKILKEREKQEKKRLREEKKRQKEEEKRITKIQKDKEKFEKQQRTGMYAFWKDILVTTC